MGNQAIYSISRTNKHDEYALLTGSCHSKDKRNRLDSLVKALRKHKSFNKICISRTQGAMGTKHFSASVQRYAKKFATGKQKYTKKE